MEPPSSPTLLPTPSPLAARKLPPMRPSSRLAVSPFATMQRSPTPPSGGKPTRPDPGRFSRPRSEEHTSELQSLMRISYAVFRLKKKTQQNNDTTPQIHNPDD